MRLTWTRYEADGATEASSDWFAAGIFEREGFGPASCSMHTVAEDALLLACVSYPVRGEAEDGDEEDEYEDDFVEPSVTYFVVRRGGEADRIEGVDENPDFEEVRWIGGHFVFLNTVGGVRAAGFDVDGRRAWERRLHTGSLRLDGQVVLASVGGAPAIFRQHRPRDGLRTAHVRRLSPPGPPAPVVLPPLDRAPRACAGGDDDPTVWREVDSPRWADESDGYLPSMEAELAIGADGICVRAVRDGSASGNRVALAASDGRLVGRVDTGEGRRHVVRCEVAPVRESRRRYGD